MPGVFVSYNREDLEVAQKIVDGLIEEGLDVWMDMDLQAGENYDEITEERLHSASAVVVLWSSRSVKSRWVRAEATIGARKNTLVPAMIEQCDRPVMFELIQCTDLSAWAGDRDEPAWRGFVETIRKRIAAAPPAPLFPTGNQPKAAPAAKAKPAKAKAAKPKAAKESRGGVGASTLILAALIVGIGAFGGVYVLRPDLVKPLFAALAAGDAPADATTVDTAGLAPDGATLTNALPVLPEPAAEPPPPEPAPTFRDCDMCPEMVNVSGGIFMMGSPDTELARSSTEGPQRKVAMAPFAMGLTEVTFEQWDACVAEGGCNGYSPASGAGGRGAQPVTLVNWSDASAYAAWLTKKTGRVYRLPSEAEWEYTARAETTTPFWWGAMYDEAKAGVSAETKAVDALEANALGLRGVSGNVREWVQDCYVNTFANAPLDGRSVEQSGCKSRVVRGGAHNAETAALRVAARDRNVPAFRDKYTGFRVAAAQ